MRRHNMTKHNLLEEIDLEEGSRAELPLRPASSRSTAARAILEVSVADITSESPLQTRQVTFDPERYPEDAELVESVQHFGVIEPVLVQPLPGGPGEGVRYQLLFGNRRVAAARLAGRVTVPALMARASEKVDGLTVAENSGRRDLTPYEKALVLVQLKAQYPGIAIADLASTTGWPQPTIYALLSAYEKSAPVLRRVFAEGKVAPRTIQAMQPLFEHTPEEQHEALAARLAGRRHEEIDLLREVVQAGQSPVAELLLTPPPQARDLQPEDVPDPKRAGRPAGSPNKAKPVAPALDVADPAHAQEIAEATGASQAVVLRLMHLAVSRGLGYPVLFAACLYVAHGGEEESALARAQAAFRHAKAGAHLRKLISYQVYLRIVRQWAIGLPKEDLRTFIQMVLGGGPR